MKYTAFLWVLLLIVCLLSCDKDPESDSPKDGIAIQTIEATANFDLSARKDWTVWVDEKRYNFEVEGNKLIITSPVASPFRFPYGATMGTVIIQMLPEDYGRVRNEMKVPYNLEDQTTSEKFMDCDRLRITYGGEIKENITGLSVYHFNTLLTFNVVNLPEDAKVSILQAYNQTVKPYQENSGLNAYKAIVFPINRDMLLMIKTPVRDYTARIPYRDTQLRDAGMATGTGNSSIVSFTAQINESDILEIVDYQKTNYSKEWPISQ